MPVIKVSELLRSNILNYCMITDCNECGIKLYNGIGGHPYGLCPNTVATILSLSLTNLKELLDGDVLLEEGEYVLLRSERSC